MKLLKIVFLVLFIEIYLVDAQVIINEVSSVNYDVFIDEDGERPDWIELYNTSNFPVNIEGWKIFDRDNIQGAWTFPSVELKAKERLLVQASGKNFSKSGKFVMEAAGEGIFTHSRNDSYRFQYTELSGDFEFSVRIHTLHNIGVFGSTGVIVREDLTNTNRFFGVLSQRDDRFVCEFLYREDTSFNYRYPVRIYSKTENLYPNIVLSVRRTGDSITSCINDIEGYCLESHTMYWDFPENVFVGIALASTNPEVPGKAIYSNLIINGNPYGFENLKFIEHDLKQPGSSYFSKELHTNFSISNGGETIYLWDATGKLADKIEVPPMYVDMSFARIPDASNSWTFSQPPTPEKPNNNPKSKILKQPIFSKKPGLYSDIQTVTINLSDINAKCYYTLDGTEPDETSELYFGQLIYIPNSTVLKARVYLDGSIPSQIETATYLINENSVGMPVISLSTNPEYFFDENIGIFHRYFDEFEYPCTFEYFDSLNNRVYKNRVGMKIHGNSSLQYPQKSMRFHTRTKYGESDFNFPFFGPDKPDSFDKLILRNAGQDWTLAFLRNSYINRVAFAIKNLESTDSKPALVFLNGEFWGMYNVLERADDDLLSSRFKVNDTSFSIIEQNLRIFRGAVNSYRVFLDSLNNFDVTSNSICDFYKNHIDIDNFIKYTTLSLYSNNDDWPTNNFKIWKSSELDNRWRWFVHDMDLCHAGSARSAYTANHLKNVLKWVEEDPNYYHIGFILVSGFKDELFKNRFLNTTCDLLNSSFLGSNMNKILDSMLYDMLPGIPLQKARWEGSVVEFDYQIELIKEFNEKRPSYYREQLREYFDLSGISKIELKSNLDSACTFNINSLKSLPIDWDGYYFNDIPIVISLERKHGFEFKHWLINDILIVHGDTLKWIPSDSATISAIFEEFIEPIPGMVVINEIMYKSADDIDSDDWVELYNPGDFDIEISGWLFKDDNNSRNFALPNNTILKSGEYLVLIESKKKFNKIYPEINNYFGEFTFGLGTDDMVRIYNRDGIIMDSVKYSNASPWYPEADGLGPSLELITAFSDNSLSSSWRVSYIEGGTPGRPNSTISVDDYILDGYLKIYPNPAINYANIQYTLEFSGNIGIEIIDLLGNHVRTILTGFYDAGNYTSYWDGTNDQGTHVGRGMYILNIKTDKGILRDKLIIE